MKTTPLQRARAACRAGYSISELITCPGVFLIRKPSGVFYTVETRDARGECEPRCNCEARVLNCKHVELVRICARYVAAMERRAEQKATVQPAKPTRRRFFSSRRLAIMRSAAPVMCAAPIDPPTPAAIDDFGEEGERIRNLAYLDY